MESEWEVDKKIIEEEWNNEVADEEVAECYRELEKLKMNCGEGQ